MEILITFKVKKLRELSIIDAENTNIASAVCFSGLPCNTFFSHFSPSAEISRQYLTYVDDYGGCWKRFDQVCISFFQGNKFSIWILISQRK